jgi:hypothetical protein
VIDAIVRSWGLLAEQGWPSPPTKAGDAVRFTFGQYQGVTRSATATFLLFQIAYWMANANATHGDRTWIARSARDWCEETALMMRQ